MLIFAYSESKLRSYLIVIFAAHGVLGGSEVEKAGKKSILFFIKYNKSKK